MATAHKIARVVYHLLTTKEPYREECAEEADHKRQERELKQLARRAQHLGYTLLTRSSTIRCLALEHSVLLGSTL